MDITFKNLSVHLQKKLESKKGKKPEVPEKPETIPEVRYVLFPVLRRFLDLPDPDPFLGGMDPDPIPVLLLSSKNSKKNLDSYCFVTSE